MVSISNIVTGAVLLGGLSAFLGLGGFKGIGQKLGQGFGDFGTSFISGISPITGALERGLENIQNPALNPLLVRLTELEAAIFPDPNLDEDKFTTRGEEEGRWTETATYDPYNPYAGTTVNQDTTGGDSDKTGGKKFTGDPSSLPQSRPLSLAAYMSPSTVNTSGYTGTQQGSYVNKSGGVSSYSSPTSNPTPSNSNLSGGNSGITGGSQPSSRQGTYSGGRRF